jgi:ADP-heptose:LPS heptosyltransferase
MKSQFDVGGDTIGDTILPEPALTSLATQQGGAVRLWVGSAKAASLYLHNPAVTLVDEPCGREIEPLPAFWEAHDSGYYFAAGFWSQLGIARQPTDRMHCKVYLPEYETAAKPPRGTTLICPYARCGSEGRMPPVEWWSPVIECLAALGEVPLCLGGPDDPPIPGTVPLQGLPLRQSAWLILTAWLVITLDSWPLHIAGGRTGPTLCLASATPPFFNRSNERVSVIYHPRKPAWPPDQVCRMITRFVRDWYGRE